MRLFFDDFFALPFDLYGTDLIFDKNRQKKFSRNFFSIFAS